MGTPCIDRLSGFADLSQRNRTNSIKCRNDWPMREVLRAAFAVPMQRAYAPIHSRQRLTAAMASFP